MEYYDSTDRMPRRIAAGVTLAVMALWFSLMGLLSFDVISEPQPLPPVEIVFEEEAVEEPKRPLVQSAPTDVRRDKAPAHEERAHQESSVQTSGEAERTETVNPNALFKPTVGNAEAVAAGNRLAPDGEEEKNRGDGAGYNLQGTDQLDAGLQGRGLREGLPKPSSSFQSSGQVVVYVTIDSNGNVTSAEIRQQGTTTQDATLRSLALEAARKAKFKPSTRTLQGGTITYKFNLK